MEGDHAEAYGDRLSDLSDEYKRAYARRDTRIIDAELRHYLKNVAYRLIPLRTSIERLSLAMLRGNVRGHEMLLERQAGRIVAAPQPSVDKGPRLLWTRLRRGEQEARSREPSSRRPGRCLRPSMRFVASMNGMAICA